MFLAKTSYADDFPINIRIVNIREYPIHYHQDIEIVFVLKGDILLKNGSCTYLLHEGDIFTNSGREVHAIYGSEKENTVAILQISNRFFTHFFPELSKSCYRTYEDRENDRRLDALRKMLLHILLEFLKKSLNYKQQCIDMVMNLIKYLNQYFNLLSFRNDVAVSFSTDNPVMIERMSRIINYLYENHARRITLKELADMEHLSTFYLSHIIKESTGMNFREFLCFARIEWSEIDLLGTDKKISAIARDVGFSTTSYYEKYFIKYFHRTPQEHREKFAPYVESPARPASDCAVDINSAISIIKRYLSQIHSQENSPSQFQVMRLDISADAGAEPIRTMDSRIEISVTLQDFYTLQGLLFCRLKELNCKEVLLRITGDEPADDMEKLRADLTACGFTVTQRRQAQLHYLKTYGADSIAAAFFYVKRYIPSDGQAATFYLRDCGDKTALLQGQPSLLTAAGVPKPAYYAALLISRLKGELIKWGRNFVILRPEGTEGTYLIAVYNYSDEISQLCSREASIHETYDIINNYHDELDISITLKNIFGEYIVTRSSLNSFRSVFGFLSKLDFPETLNLSDSVPLYYYATPDTDVHTETVDKTLSLRFSIKGAGIQIVNIERKK